MSENNLYAIVWVLVALLCGGLIQSCDKMLARDSARELELKRECIKRGGSTQFGGCMFLREVAPQ
jgi:hypothetical protein